MKIAQLNNFEDIVKKHLGRFGIIFLKENSINFSQDIPYAAVYGVFGEGIGHWAINQVFDGIIEDYEKKCQIYWVDYSPSTQKKFVIFFTL